MSFLDLAKKRKSIRGFTEKAVPHDMVMTLLEAARFAPSGGNCQPWHFYVIRDRAVIDIIHEKSLKQEFIKTAPALIAVCADIPLTVPRYGERGRELYCIQDTAAAIQNILLCAAEMGLGACWCGAFDEATASEILNLDEYMRPVAIIPIGWPATNPDSLPGRPRRPVSEIATFIGENM